MRGQTEESCVSISKCQCLAYKRLTAEEPNKGILGKKTPHNQICPTVLLGEFGGGKREDETMDKASCVFIVQDLVFGSGVH